MRHALLICSLFWLCCQTVFAQKNYFDAGMAIGYRTLNMSDIREAYALQGFYSRPYNGTPVVSVFAQANPFKKKRAGFILEYSHMPRTIRNNNFTLIDTFTFSSVKRYDSSVFSSYTVAKLQTASFSITYQLPIKKILLKTAAGISYNVFSMKGDQDYTSYSGTYGDTLTKNTVQVRDKWLNRQKGFGFVCQAGIRYKIYGNLYIHSTLYFHAANIPLKDENGKKIDKSPGYVGFQGAGIYYPRSLSAQLTGIQLSIGLDYTISEK